MASIVFLQMDQYEVYLHPESGLGLLIMTDGKDWLDWPSDEFFRRLRKRKWALATEEVEDFKGSVPYDAWVPVAVASKRPAWLLKTVYYNGTSQKKSDRALKALRRLL